MAVLTDEITPVLAGVRRKLCKSSASDNMSGEKEFQFFEKAMQKAPGYRISKRTIPRSCKECEFYQPKWKYRSCYGTNYQKLGKDMPYLFVKSSVALNLS